MTAELSVQNVGHTYATETVLAGVSFDVQKGSIHCLVGPSGSGKTTLLRIVAGLIKPRKGRVLIRGTDTTLIPPHKRDIGFVFQTTEALFPHLTVRGNVEFAFRHGCRRETTDDWRGQVKDILDKTGIGDLASRRIAELSGGQKQRVAIARSLVYRPSVLLLDEPMSGLDNDNRSQLMDLIVTLRRETGVAFLYVTHDDREVRRIADAVGVLVEGELRQSGKTDEVFATPVNPQVARILGITVTAELQ